MRYSKGKGNLVIGLFMISFLVIVSLHIVYGSGDGGDNSVQLKIYHNGMELKDYNDKITPPSILVGETVDIAGNANVSNFVNWTIELDNLSGIVNDSLCFGDIAIEENVFCSWNTSEYCPNSECGNYTLKLIEVNSSDPSENYTTEILDILIDNSPPLIDINTDVVEADASYWFATASITENYLQRVDSFIFNNESRLILGWNWMCNSTGECGNLFGGGLFDESWYGDAYALGGEQMSVYQGGIYFPDFSDESFLFVPGCLDAGGTGDYECGGSCDSGFCDTYRWWLVYNSTEPGKNQFPFVGLLNENGCDEVGCYLNTSIIENGTTRFKPKTDYLNLENGEWSTEDSSEIILYDANNSNNLELQSSILDSEGNFTFAFRAKDYWWTSLSSISDIIKLGQATPDAELYTNGMNQKNIGGVSYSFLSGVYNITGYANSTNFSNWTIELDNSSGIVNASLCSGIAAVNGLFCQWNTSAYCASGECENYTLKLTVFNNWSNTFYSINDVAIDNLAPRVTMLSVNAPDPNNIIGRANITESYIKNVLGYIFDNTNATVMEWGRFCGEEQTDACNTILQGIFNRSWGKRTYSINNTQVTVSNKFGFNNLPPGTSTVVVPGCFDVAGTGDYDCGSACTNQEVCDTYRWWLVYDDSQESNNKTLLGLINEDMSSGGGYEVNSSIIIDGVSKFKLQSDKLNFSTGTWSYQNLTSITLYFVNESNNLNLTAEEEDSGNFTFAFDAEDYIGRSVLSSQGFEIKDIFPPTYTSVIKNSTIAGQAALFSVDVNDDRALNPDGQYIFSTNNSGSWVNGTAVNFTTTPSSVSVVETLNSTIGVVVGYRWYFSDNLGNANSTPIYTLTTRDDPSSSSAFVSVWNTASISGGSSNSDQIMLPLVSDGVYNFKVYWGDDTSDEITAYDQPEATHTYSSQGTYMINITGTIIGWGFNNFGDRLKLSEITQWGKLNLGNDGDYFWGAENMQITATDSLNLTGTTDFSYAFANCYDIATIPNIGNWNMSEVTDMDGLFYSSNFNGNINGWDTSKVTNMASMFSSSSFNGDISSWNTGKVTDMSAMFSGDGSFNVNIQFWNVSSVTNMASMFNSDDSFNRNIGNWNTGKVTDMSSMFNGATSFNQSLNNWNTGNVTNMNSMFNGATLFNGNISSWEVPNVTSMDNMFFNCNSFNQEISGWNTSNVTSMSYMFEGASNFNQPIGDWNTSKVTSMNNMFYGATSFNQSLNNWDVSSVSNMNSMFRSATIFNGDIEDWDVSSVTDMGQMFLSDSSFNGNIVNWNTKSVITMSAMFQNDIGFNENVSAWNITKVTIMSNMFKNSSLSILNYNSLLIFWAAESVKNNVPFNAGNAKYSNAAVSSRNHLTGTHSWTITDGGFISGPNITFAGSINTSGNYNQDFITANVSVQNSSAIASLTISLYNQSGLIIQNSSNTSTIFLWNITGLAYGNYSLNSTVSDSNGLTNQTDTLNISLEEPDTTAPIVDIISPADGNTYTSSTVSVSISLNEAGYCVYSIGSGGNNTLTANGDDTSFTGTSSTLSNGNYVLHAYCNDSAGYRNDSVSSAFTINVQGGGGGGGGGGSVTPPATTYPVDDAFLSTGDSFTLSKSDKISFTVNGNSHSLTLNSFNASSAKVVISSNPITAYLEKGILNEIDLDGDSVKDIQARYDGVVNSKAQVFLQKITPVVEETTGAVITNNQEETNTGTAGEELNTNTQVTTNEKNPTPIKTLTIIIVVALIIVLFGIFLLERKRKRRLYSYYG